MYSTQNTYNNLNSTAATPLNNTNYQSNYSNNTAQANNYTTRTMMSIPNTNMTQTNTAMSIQSPSYTTMQPLYTQHSMSDGSNNGISSTSHQSSTGSGNSSPQQYSNTTSSPVQIYNTTTTTATIQQCESCRQQKRRCDGLQPHCSHCQRYNTTCNYERISKKRGPKPGQIKRLRDTINALKQEIQYQRTLNNSNTMKHNPTQNGKKQRLNNTTAFSTSKVLDSWLDPPTSPSINNTAVTDYQTKALQMSSGISNTVEYLTSQQNLSRNSTSVNLYFSRLNPLLPILSRNEFTYDKVRVINNGSLVDYSFLLRYSSVIALGSTLDGARDYGISAMNVARAMAGKLLDEPSSDNARGFLLLALHCIGQRLYQQASVHVAVAKRMCLLQGTLCPQELPMVCDYLSSLLNNQDVDTNVAQGVYQSTTARVHDTKRQTSITTDTYNLPLQSQHVTAFRDPSVMNTDLQNNSFPRNPSYTFTSHNTNNNTTTNEFSDYGAYNGVNFSLAQLGLNYADSSSALDADLPLLADVNTLPLDHSNLTQADLVNASNYLGLRSPLPYTVDSVQNNERQISSQTPQKPNQMQYELPRTASYLFI